MNVGDTYKTSQMLGSTQLNGKQALTVDTRTKNDMVIVKHNDTTDRWEPLEKLDESLSKDKLSDGYGLWEDKKVTKGHLWWKETIREKNNQIEPDEVKTFKEIINDTYYNDDGRMEADVLKYNDLTIASATSSVTGPFGLLIGLVTCEKEVFTRVIHTEADLPPL